MTTDAVDNFCHLYKDRHWKKRTGVSNLHLVSFSTQHFCWCRAFTQKLSEGVLLQTHISHSSRRLAGLLARMNKHQHLQHPQLMHVDHTLSAWLVCVVLPFINFDFSLPCVLRAEHVSKFEVSFECFCLCCDYCFDSIWCVHCLLLSTMFAWWIKIPNISK